MDNNSQTVVNITSKKVILQNLNTAYSGSYEDYINDGGVPLLEGLAFVDYFDDNGKTFIAFDNKAISESEVAQFVNRIITKIPLLAIKYEQRLIDLGKAQGRKNLEAQAYEAEQNRINELQALSLEDTKTRALKMIKSDIGQYTKYSNPLVFFTSHLGFKVNGDQRSLDTLRSLLDTFDQQTLIDGKLAFLDYDNVYQYISKADLQLLILETQANLFNLFKSIQDFKAAIRNAASIQSIYSNTQEFTLKQFLYRPSDFSSVNLLTAKSIN